MSNIYNDLIKVIDENSDDIIWRTTENGHKVGFKGKEAVAGNKEVIKELNQNSPTITKEFTKKDFNNFTKEDLRKSKAYRQYAINALSKELNFKPITNTYFEESDWSYQEISLPDGVTCSIIIKKSTGNPIW